ncbi:MAG: Tfp pilus assembly protein PilF [Hyphomicrobiaceae bacterium]|jgi:Tfp pilus assembly protein PilF
MTFPDRFLAVRCTIAVLVAFACGAASPSFATESGRAERLYSKALVEFHADRPEAAATLLEQAVALNPQDAQAQYYLGVTLGRLGRLDEAADALQIAAERAPSLLRADLELGWVLISAGRHDEAAVVLAQARGRESTAGRANLLDGINEVRRGNYAIARERLNTAVTTDPSQVVPARYYRGLAAYEAHDLVAAEEDFSYVAETVPTDQMGIEAQKFLDRIGDELTPSFRMRAGIGFEYDSNVSLAPNDDSLSRDQLGITNKDDVRTVLTAGGSYAIHADENFQVSVSYDVVQSLHADLSEFDLQTHRLGAQVAHFRGPITLGLNGTWGYSFLDTESFLSEGALMPWLRVAEGEFGHAELYYRLRNRDYILDPFAAPRDSFNHTAGARQFFYLDGSDRYVSLGYRWDHDDADNAVGKRFNYDGHQFEAGVGWRFAGEITADAIYAYKLEDYSHPDALGRDDDEQTVVVRAEKRLGRLLWATASYVTRLNDSNQAAFDYDRHIGSVGLEARY